MVENTPITPSAADYALAEKIIHMYRYQERGKQKIAQLLADSRTPEERHASEMYELLAECCESDGQIDILRMEYLMDSIERERAEGEAAK